MRSLISALLLALACNAWALDKSAVERLAFGDAEEKTAALAALVAEADARAVPLLEALAEGDVQTAGKRVLIVNGHGGNIAALASFLPDLARELPSLALRVTTPYQPAQKAIAKVLGDRAV